MKKIPMLYERDYCNYTSRGYGDNDFTFKNKKPIAGMEWVEEGKGVATIKYDGSCCAIIDGELYKRYDAGIKGRKVPDGAIPCQEEADPITKHFPCWVACSRDNPADKYFYAAYDLKKDWEDGTYELVGAKVQRNPYNLPNHQLWKHGKDIIEVGRDFESIKKYLENHEIEGIVFWLDGEPKCKIRRKDFGFRWN